MPPQYQNPYNTSPSGYADLSSNLQYPPPTNTDYASAQDTSQRHNPQAQPSAHPPSHHTPSQPPPPSHQHPHPPSHHSQQPAPSPSSQQQPSQYHSMYGASSPSSPYDPSVTPYPPRQSAALEVLSNQFGGVPPTYYVGANEGGPTSAPAGALAQGVQGQGPYSGLSYTGQSPVGREGLASGYGTGMAEQSNQSYATAAQQQQQGGGGYGGQTAELDSAFGSYQDALRRTFESVRDGNLVEAGGTIVQISEWLLTNAEVLGESTCASGVVTTTEIDIGLVRDDEATYAERLKLWGEFNNCWLAMLQRQRELTAEMIDTGQRPHPPQSILEADQMENMGKELVRLCDIMEKHGLVDYQMGVWEEEIIGRKYSLSLCRWLLTGPVLTSCLDMMGDPSTVAGASRRR